MTIPTRISPLSAVLQGYAVAVADVERETANDLAFCDISGFERCIFKGKDAAAAYLSDAGITLPEKINGVVEIDGGGLVMRTGGAEWLVEARPPCPPILGEDVTDLAIAKASTSPLGKLLSQFSNEPDASILAGVFSSPRIGGQGGRSFSGAYLYPAPGASFLLSGTRASDILLETCNVDLRSPGPDLVMTRVAGVSCYILQRTLNGIPAYQVWTDASYAHYLGETLLAIIHEYNGGVAGVSCYFPEVLIPQT